MDEQAHVDQRIACQPNKPESIPWQSSCRFCDTLRSDPQPGLHTWVLGVARHMETAHSIELVGS